MTTFLSIVTIAISVSALVYMRATDAKRRRVFGLKPRPRRFPLLVRGALWLPAIALIALGNVAALLIWMGAVTVAGWGIAAVTPAMVDAASEATVAYRAALRAKTQHLGTLARQAFALGKWRLGVLLSSERPGRSDDRVAALEARIAELEAELARRDEDAPRPGMLEAQGSTKTNFVIAGSRS
ncbi:MAG: hypothetical protein AAF844_05020 [Pseudomonadota bacterium]